MKIASVRALQLLDCNARPMVEVEVTTQDGHVGRGAAPTGQSVGSHEAAVLRDGDPDDYDGLSVHQAVRNVEEQIAPALVGRDVEDQEALDQTLVDLDGTPDKSRLGGNALYSTSIALLRAAAATHDQRVYERVAAGRALTALPVPCFNLVNGGRNGEVVQPFNEFLVVPHGARTAEEAVRIGVSVFRRLGDVIRRATGRTPPTGKSMGFVAPSGDPRAVLELLRQAVDETGHTKQVGYALDCASSEMYDTGSGTYLLGGERVSSGELVDYTRSLTEEFPLVFVEDLLDENDWDGWAHANTVLDRTILLGDDLVVTNRARLERALELRAIDGFILKPNQVGTISESLSTYAFASENDLLAIPSGRSGGVVDDVVVDLSLGLQVPFQKNGAPRSGERIEKLNFLLRAADRLGTHHLADLTGLVRF